MRIMAYFVLIFFVFLVSLYVTAGFLLKTQKTIMCPDIRGLNLPQAELILKKRGLELQISRYEKRNDVAKGIIVRQRPEPNVPVREGRKVYVTVSSGPELVIVPNLKGLALETAENVLLEKKLKIKKKIFVPSKIPGKILAHIPQESEKVLEGEGITIITGKKAENFFVMPDISDWDLKEVLEELEAKEIAYKVVYVRNEIYGITGRISVDKKAGAIIRSDEVVTINVFLGG